MRIVEIGVNEPLLLGSKLAVKVEYYLLYGRLAGYQHALKRLHQVWLARPILNGMGLSELYHTFISPLPSHL